MNIVNISTYRDPSCTPVIIFVDLQQEYLSQNRRLALAHTKQALENCGRLLSFARENGLPVAHVRWSQKSLFFNRGQSYSNWIEGFGPKSSDMIFERSLPSCFSSEPFAEMMAQGGGQNAVLAGFTGTIACLSTIIEAAHRDHSMTFISDASASHGIRERSEAEVHGSVVDIISLYSGIATTDQWISQQTNVYPIAKGLSQ